ncbi:riboflavin synthase [Puniceicoccus vermicola]|uniref:Riboflavin synthase n=1 Tax=Puniceicoccus vermicola TaxID=388746 RepID=A0A7X1AY53_9BACT|nr:riboflavin synthase [Puniceicoccus vermicola]MBC2602112.1 riboflavin synthase [Puniceicoccus vermicola]
MFTGLVEAAGKVLRFEEDSSGFQLDVEMPEAISGYALGDSIAVNGCCLTVARQGEGYASFDLLAETVRRTSFAGLTAGRWVNLERSLLPTTRMGGHFVSGHIDESGVIEVFEPRGADYYLQVSCSQEGMAYMVEKGSIAVDGISLTVAEVHESGFAVWLIPHTLAETNLKDRSAGERVNLEFDLLAKHVERMLSARMPIAAAGS